MSSHPNKRKRLKSPQQVSSSNSSINVSPISDDDDVKVIPLISVEDISDSEGESAPPQNEPGPSKLNSPAKKMGLLCSAGQYNKNLLTQSKLKFQPVTKRLKLDTSKTTISIADSPGQSKLRSPNTNPLTKPTIGSPKCMVQEVSSTVLDLPSSTPKKRSFQEVSSTVDIQPVVQKKILFTSLDSNTKERLRLMISKLGGAVYLEIPNFTDECTHIILGKPNTGEKYLGGLMCGKWLLKTEYIEESYAQNKWLEEDGFEWSDDNNNFSRNNSPIQQPDKQDIGRLGAAAKRCRQQYAHQPPFHDWVAVILCMHPKRQDCYERLFKCGGGRVVNISDYLARYNEITHVFIGRAEQTLLPQCFHTKPLNTTKTIPVLRINYLHSYVIEETAPSLDDFRVKVEAPAPETPSERLPEAPWRESYWRDCKRTDTVSAPSSEQISEFVRSLFEAGNIDEDSHSAVRQITLPLLVGCIPSADILRTLVSSTLLKATVSFTMRECLGVLGMVRWAVPPVFNNRAHFLKMLGTVAPNQAELFGEILLDAVKPEFDREWPQSPLYILWWAELLEEDFAMWQKQPKNKPLIEYLFGAWHFRSRLLKTLLAAVSTALSNANLQDKLLMGLMSILTVLYTSCEIKDKVRSETKTRNKNIATDQISSTLAASLTSYVLRRDMTTVRKFITMLGANTRVLLKVASETLSNLNQASVPHQYKFLAQKSMSWEKFFHFQLHLQPRSVRTDYQPSTSGESPPKWVQKRTVKGETAFHVACRAGHVERIKTLLAYKIPINDTDHAGWTGLHEACNSAQYLVVKEVVEHCNSDPDEQIDFTLESVEGTTILHEAVKGGDQRIVKLLLQAGAGLSLDIKDKSGKTPLETAEDPVMSRVIEKFIAEGSDEPTSRKTFNSQDIEILLLLLSTVFRILLAKCQPPSTLQPVRELTALEYRLSLTHLTPNSTMLLSLLKAGVKE